MPKDVAIAEAADDKAGREYWDDVWGEHFAQRRRWLYPTRRVAAWLDDQVRTASARAVLEVGCGNSSWLPYLARVRNRRTVGIDYSEHGCELARRRLVEHDVQAEVHCQDMFAPPGDLGEAFDAVFTYGVVEHFSDTAGAVSALAGFLAPGGVALTLVPNFTGLPGRVQALLSRSVYEKHVPLTREQLVAAHEAAGLEVLSCRYLVFCSFAVANLNDVPVGTWEYRAKRALLRGLTAISMLAWGLESATGSLLPANRWTSPYLVCTARRTRG